MNNLPRICWTVSACLGLAGMVWGMQMAGSGDHSNLAAHAHLNLLGWVGLALYGTYYRLIGLTRSRVASIQVGCAIVGSVIMGIGIAIAHQGGTEAIAIIGSLLTLVAGALFAAITFQRPLRVNSGL
ncbi:MAG: hypothetical protein CMO06_13710 [Thalassospira sp.]|uniref:hypothetical protein n=1 Tax=Thalassospira sp. TaxID=1912094 RepID=UPI000C4AC623|nr:hypothetical protein [Thalassospira sp.]MAZ34196.1 hypothetical protein [Thalassospira sp.]|tara:strand:- start:59 stop:439 length:381 start_codon:yes stop_codon:yes gene_type:complete